MELPLDQDGRPKAPDAPGLSRDRLGLVVGLVLLGVGLSFLIQIPSQTLSFELLGRPFQVAIEGDWIVNVILVGLVCTGVDSMIRHHPKVRARAVGYTLTFWILPAALTLASISFLRLSPDKLYWLLGLGLSGGLLALVIVGQHHTVDSEDPHYGAARLSLNIVTYLAGLGVFMSIYETKARSLFSSTAIGLTALLLSLELLRGAQDDAGRTWLYALSVGAIMGELTWALNYWGIGGAMGGVFLLLAFYLLTGLCQSYFRGRLSRRVAIEFAAVAAIGLGLLGRYSPWAW